MQTRHESQDNPKSQVGSLTLVSKQKKNSIEKKTRPTDLFAFTKTCIDTEKTENCFERFEKSYSRNKCICK